MLSCRVLKETHNITIIILLRLPTAVRAWECDDLLVSQIKNVYKPSLTQASMAEGADGGLYKTTHKGGGNWQTEPIICLYVFR